jgi:hypothetical protein
MEAVQLGSPLAQKLSVGDGLAGVVVSVTTTLVHVIEVGTAFIALPVQNIPKHWLVTVNVMLQLILLCFLCELQVTGAGVTDEGWLSVCCPGGQCPALFEQPQSSVNVPVPE